MKKDQPRMRVRVIKPREIKKADKPVQLSEEEGNNSAEWLNPDYDMKGLAEMVSTSTILPQCIRAYKNNIAGFGIGIRYIDDEKETPEMAEEFERAEEIIELLNLEQDTKEVFEDLIEARETYGIAYLEVIRDMAGNVVQVEFVKETPTIQKTRPLEPYISTTYFHKGREVERKKRFCKYKQMIGGKTVYFKEFGDPRIMDLRDGRYILEGESLELQYQANELIEFALGTEPYGTVRWIGQCLTIDGARRAENLNNNYFVNGRHTPLMIMVKGGTLSDDSFMKLQEYIEGIKGEAGQHAFIVLETEATDGRMDFDQQNRPEVEIKDLASILQRDELFGEYLENHRKKVQSSFQLPDLYVAYTTDFNRATAQTAQEITEKQVFQPERKSLAWMVNNRLLNGYNFKYVEAYFLEPDISNPDDLFRILTAANYAGGVTPNFAKKIMYEVHGEVAEDYPEEWGDTPLTIYQMQQGQGQQQMMGEGLDQTVPGIGPNGQPQASYSQSGIQQSSEPEQPEPVESQEEIDERISQQLEKQIAKAMEHNDDEIVAVMKEVRKQLVRLNEKSVEKGWITTEDGEHIFIGEGGTAHGGEDGYIKSKEEEAGNASRKELEKLGSGEFKSQTPEDMHRAAEYNRQYADKLRKYIDDHEGTMTQRDIDRFNKAANRAEKTADKMDKEIESSHYSHYPSEIAGVSKGPDMTFEEADTGNTNPNYPELEFGCQKDPYYINCQTCVIAHEARMRGYDVEATGFDKKNENQVALSEYCARAWVDPETGKTPNYVEMSGKSYTANTYYKFMDKTIQEGERYEFQVVWKGRGAGAHIVTASKDENGLFIYDPQDNKKTYGEDIKKEYLSRVRLSTKQPDEFRNTAFDERPKLLRVDNLSFNEKAIEGILTKKG